MTYLKRSFAVFPSFWLLVHVVEDNLFYNVCKLMILASAQGEQHVLGRDVDHVPHKSLPSKQPNKKEIPEVKLANFWALP